jgi:carboxyl-terminal processing protease
LSWIGTPTVLVLALMSGAGFSEEPPRPAGLQAAVAASAAPQPGPNDRHIAVAVRRHLEREHFLRRPLDDGIARLWFDAFLESLDPMKVYFLQSDIDQFMAKRDTLDDGVKKGDVSFAYQVLQRFLQRVDERLPVIERLIDTPHDFTRDESLVTDRKAATWAATGAELDDTWRKRIKYDLLLQKMEKTPPEEA